MIRQLTVGLLGVAWIFAAPLSAQMVDLDASFSAQVEEDEIDSTGGGAAVDQVFFNVQGDDDAFTVYSLADFDTASLGLSGVVDATNIVFGLSQANAFFSADGGLEFFLAEDTRAVDLTDTARYIQSGDPTDPNIGAEVVGTAFGTLHSLGSGNFVETVDGDLDTFDFSLDAAGEAFFLNQVNSGGILRVIATPGDAAVQATYSGAESGLTPPAPPSLSFTAVTAVPEPSTAIFGFLLLGSAVLRRQRI